MLRVNGARRFVMGSKPGQHKRDAIALRHVEFGHGRQVFTARFDRRAQNQRIRVRRSLRVRRVFLRTQGMMWP